METDTDGEAAYEEDTDKVELVLTLADTVRLLTLL
jgi:hypothetical protein